MLDPEQLGDTLSRYEDATTLERVELSLIASSGGVGARITATPVVVSRSGERVLLAPSRSGLGLFSARATGGDAGLEAAALREGRRLCRVSLRFHGTAPNPLDVERRGDEAVDVRFLLVAEGDVPDRRVLAAETVAWVSWARALAEASDDSVRRTLLKARRAVEASERCPSCRMLLDDDVGSRGGPCASCAARAQDLGLYPTWFLALVGLSVAGWLAAWLARKNWLLLGQAQRADLVGWLAVGSGALSAGLFGALLFAPVGVVRALGVSLVLVSFLSTGLLVTGLWEPVAERRRRGAGVAALGGPFALAWAGLGAFLAVLYLRLS